MLKRTLIFSSPSKLSLSSGQLLIERKHLPNQTVPIEDIGFVVLEHHKLSVTLPLLVALNRNNASVVVCDETHMPISMFLNLDGNSVQTELFAYQINASEPLKKNLWKQTVEAKIRNQISLLKSLDKSADDILAMVKYVKSGDASNREGAAARIYWLRLFGSEFIRERNGAPPNMLLNYGYTVLRAAVARALAGSGLLSTLGIFHKNRYNSFCLADDIMEPYRPFVDEVVFHLFSANPGIIQLGKEHKAYLLRILTADVLINKRTRPLMVALSQSTASLARCFAKKTNKIQYPEFFPK